MQRFVGRPFAAKHVGEHPTELTAKAQALVLPRDEIVQRVEAHFGRQRPVGHAAEQFLGRFPRRRALPLVLEPRDGASFGRKHG